MEAMIVLINNGGWIYYKIRTRLTSAKAALIEFRHASEHAGINTDNLHIKEVVLRDKNGNDINRYILQ